MSYQDEADLANDPDFNRRLSAALCDESRGQVTDSLGKVVMNSPAQGVVYFMPFVSTAPTFGDKYAAGGQESITDGDLLSAIQAEWDDVKTVHDLS